MALKDFYEREKHVALNAQSKKFRITKWIIIFLIAAALYFWKEVAQVAALFLFCAVIGTGAHFFLRWKTNEWTRSWGPYKRITLNGE